MGTQIGQRQFFEFRAETTEELKQRVESLRKQLSARGGGVLDVEWTENGATVLCEVPSPDRPQA